MNCHKAAWGWAYWMERNVVALRISQMGENSNSSKHWSFFKVSPFVNVKTFLYSPEMAVRVPVCWGNQISKELTHEGGNVVR